MAKIYGNRWKTSASAGEGGAGYIYKVTDTTSDGDDFFALKRLKNINRIDRFETEINALKKLDHPGINKVIDYSLDENPYFVTEFVEGKSFAALPKLTLIEALDITENLAVIVDYANSQGVVHRDIKPENIMLNESNSVIVLDFGICHLVDEEGRLTETQEQAGSRFFMAPEMGDGRADNVTQKVDTYAIAKILYFLLTGKKINRENVEGENDLRKITGEEQADYITQKILLPALQVDPEKRCDTQNIIRSINSIRTLIKENYRPGIVGTKCLICGEGRYVRDYENRINVNIMNSEKSGTPNVDLQFIRCNECSNLQWFKHLPTKHPT